MSPRTRQYRPGELAPISGIYLAIHGDAPRRGDEASQVQHRPPHEVMVIRGEELPSCRTCRVDVRFEVQEPVTHVRHDADFMGVLLT